MESNKIYRIVIISIFVLVVIVAAIRGVRSSAQAHEKSLNYHFAGVVDSVSYDVKGGASVVISGSHYYLGPPFWLIDHKIQKGDSLLKDRNSMIIKQINLKGSYLFKGD